MTTFRFKKAMEVKILFGQSMKLKKAQKNNKSRLMTMFSALENQSKPTKSFLN
jgi:hypothetical protein